MILISILFIVPVYYLAKSKGYSGAVFGITAAALAFVCWFPLPVAIPALGILELILPATVLLIVALLPKRQGAPGKEYLKITMQCPECLETIEFDREREGMAELCPKCGEIIRVPTDQWSPKSVEAARRKPVVTSGEVCFDRFGQRAAAYEIQTILTSNGISSRVIENDAGGSLPLIAIAQYPLMIDIADWDKVSQIEKECQQSAAPLPRAP